MTVCTYIARARAAALYDLRLTIAREDALDPLDAGVTELLALTKSGCERIVSEFAAAGYEMRSELRAALAPFLGDQAPARGMSAGTARTAQRAEGEARQPGPATQDAPNPDPIHPNTSPIPTTQEAA